MKIAILTILFFLSSFSFAGEENNLHQLQGFDFNSNQVVELKDFKGKIIYLDFWASWCPPCLKSMPFMEKLHQQYNGVDFEIVAINIDKDKSDAVEFLQQQPISFLNLYDPKGKIGKRLKVRAMPTAFLFDREGKLLYRHSGFDDNYAKKLKSVLKGLLNKSKTAKIKDSTIID